MINIANPSLSKQLSFFQEELTSKLPDQDSFETLCNHCNSMMQANSHEHYRTLYDKAKNFALLYNIRWTPEDIYKRLVALNYIESPRKAS